MSWFTKVFASKRPLTEAEKCFTKEELDALHAHIRQAAHAGSGSAAVRVNLPVFCELSHLPETGPQGQVTQLIFNTISRGQNTADALDIIEAKAKSSYMGDDAAKDFSFSLLCALAKTPTATLGALQLCQALSSLFCLLLSSPPDTLPQPLLAAIAQGALLHAAGPACSAPAQYLDRDGYARWVKVLPTVHLALTSLLNNVGKLGAIGAPMAATAAVKAQSPGVPTSHLPPGMPAVPLRILGPGKLTDADLLLHPIAAVELAACLSQDLRQEWRLLFHSQRDGKSFQTFMGRLAASPGETLLLIKDKGGNIMGGFAPQEWRKSGSYYGDATSFVFGVHPAFQVFPATGINNNIQWCGMGFSELPNGVGFGGAQGGHNGPTGQFAVFVDSTLDNGMSRPIATFGSPSLSSTQVFEVDTVECWLLRPPEEEEESPASSAKGSSRSVLDRQQDRNFLGMAGLKVDHSAGVRDGRPEDDL